jgi:hypothetical protein
MEGLLSSISRRGFTGRPLPDTDHSGHGHLQHNHQMSLSGTHNYNGFQNPKPGPWMNNLCHDPHDDMESCCIGFWIPCALYGKTQYRFEQMAEGKDPLDESRREACNGPCLMYQIFMCFRFDCEFCFSEPHCFRISFICADVCDLLQGFS